MHQTTSPALSKFGQSFSRGFFGHSVEVRVWLAVRGLGPNSAADVVLQTHGCSGHNNAVRSLEHVQVMVTLSASQRGKVELALTSPSGTRQIMLARRHVDTSYQGLNRWVLMTVHCWGEDPRGNWTLTISTTSTSGTKCQQRIVEKSASLIMFLT